MQTHFITVEIDVLNSPQDLSTAIHRELSHRGEPLRWAITRVLATTVLVEAVVTTPE